MRNLFFFTLIFGYTSFVFAKHFWRGETMSISQVCAKWGSKTKFDKEKFKIGTELQRAEMVCSLLRDPKVIIGTDRAIVRKELGDFSGYYFSDMFPTYIIESGKNKNEDTWQLVFLLKKDETISEIIMHKNCCDR